MDQDVFQKILNLTCIYFQYNQIQTELNISICKNGTLFNAENYSVDVIARILGFTELAIIVVGFIANILVLTLTILDKTLHKPTFTAIGALSVADLFCLCTLLINEFGPFGYTFTYDIVMFVFSISSLHVLLIALVRYIILVHPFVARNHLSCKKMIFSSFLCYVISICITLTVFVVAGNYWNVFIISIFTYYYCLGLMLLIIMCNIVFSVLI